MSLSAAKNAMHRAIDELYCRKLTNQEKDQIWKYFNSRCAYCDQRISRKRRHGHMDHLDCSALGGGNYIRNRVLACKECNGNEKREQDWQEFLRSKCVDCGRYRERTQKIISWQSKFPSLSPVSLDTETESARQALVATIETFEQEFIRFRSLISRVRARRN